jgi:co-chaperonin GroES (HSP10)
MSLPKMLHDRVLIKPDEVKEDSSGFVNPHEKPKANTGVVVSVGDGFVGISTESESPIVIKIPLTVRVGDRVKYDHRMFCDFKIEDELFVDGKEGDIICILN